MKLKYLFSFLALAGIFASCQKEKEADRFYVDATEYSADYEGGSVSVVVNTNLAWTATPQASYDWLTASELSGNGNGDICFTISANTGDIRTAQYTITAGSFEPVNISITQEAVKSSMKLGAPYVAETPYVNVEGIKIKVPYNDANGLETVDFTFSFSGIAKGSLTTASATAASFAAGKGEVAVTIPVTPTTLGPLTIVANAYGEDLEPMEVRVCEKPKYQNYIYWNFWAVGYTRSDFNALRGSKYDLSFTSQALNPTASGVGEDHKVLFSDTSLSGCEGAYLAVHCANPIVAAGDDGGKLTGTPANLAGYQFNPGMQVQGLVKDDYIFAYIPKVNIPAGGNIVLESSLGGAKAAACMFLVQYSTDGTNWITFDDPLTFELEGVKYEYHYQYLADNSAMRYVYFHDIADPAFARYVTKVASAVNGPLWVRYLAVGINGAPAVQTATGWSDIKFIELSFDN